MTWPEWFAASGADVRPPTPRIVFDHYSTVVQEALVGHGVALGWRHLVGDLVRRRLLVPVGPIVDHAGVGHHLCWRSGRHDRRVDAIGAELLSRLGAEPDPLD